eukprot:TRINITY_DN756_c0_g1_i1.p1 TRINITY_DN756_c0_g1~~TRINITY_DN756_c0_g1_i1.p1  ORF type:complete len:259 (+),score=70.06 TRINITY_DN756_c0_g1_i1:53-778(+)
MSQNPFEALVDGRSFKSNSELAKAEKNKNKKAKQRAKKREQKEKTEGNTRPGNQNQGPRLIGGQPQPMRFYKKETGSPRKQNWTEKGKSSRSSASTDDREELKSSMGKGNGQREEMHKVERKEKVSNAVSENVDVDEEVSGSSTTSGNNNSASYAGEQGMPGAPGVPMDSALTFDLLKNLVNQVQILNSNFSRAGGYIQNLEQNFFMLHKQAQALNDENQKQAQQIESLYRMISGHRDSNY